jgi:hypothetical protein
MTSPTTREAIDIIDGITEGPGAKGPLEQPFEFVKALPDRAAALKTLIGRDEILQTAQKYHAADLRAVAAQMRFVRMGRVTAYTGFLAAIIGGLLLYFGSAEPTRTLYFLLEALQFGLLAISLLGSLALYTLKPFRTWRQERGEAEWERVSLFARIMSGRTDNADPLQLPLQLECFRRYLLEDQLKYFKRRGPQHRRAVRWALALRLLALALLLLAAVPLLAKIPWLPDWARAALAWFPIEGPGVPEMYALGGLVGGALQGLLAALAVISLSERNADKFARMAERLQAYAETRLPEAREAAAQGNGLVVGEFARQIACDLAAEASEWVAVQEALASITLEHLGGARRMT